jgi:hypothetical protein
MRPALAGVKGATDDKPTFNRSGVVGFITYRDGDRERQHAIMRDLGYVRITRTCPNAVLPRERAPYRQMTDTQAAHNQPMGRDRIFVENFFGCWKSLFEICRGVYRGDVTQLDRIVRITIWVTNFDLTSHPLRALAPSQPLTDDEKGGEGPAVPLD